MSHNCSRCGSPIANGHVGPCPICGSWDVVSSLAQAYGNVFEKIVGSENSGSLSVATTAVSTMSSAFYTANIHLSSLKAIGTPEKYLMPLEEDIKRLNEEKIRAEEKLKKLSTRSPDEREAFAAEVTKAVNEATAIIRKDIQMVGLKVNGAAELIKKIDEKVATKDDVFKLEKLILENQEFTVDRLSKNKEELKQILAEAIGTKISQEDKSILWESLDKLSVLGGVAQFAEYVRMLFDFLNEKKILQIVLPIILKVIFGR